MFLYDEDSSACGCCSTVQVTTLADSTFASAVYSYSANDDLTEAPAYCISGSTLYYPDASGGPDVAHPCECGKCTTCGAGEPRYMDWSGPFVVPDPVDTCLCDDSSVGACESDFAVAETES